MVFDIPHHDFIMIVTPLVMGRDTMAQEWNVMEEISEDTFVLQTLAPSALGGLIAAREFVDVMCVRQHPDSSDGYIIASKSIGRKLLKWDLLIC